MKWEKAPEIQAEVARLVEQLFGGVDVKRVIAFRSYGSSSRAVARIWGLPKIWQQALGVEAHYCLEVLSEKFDKRSKEERQRILIHELMHIPKNFSGALLPHRSRGRAINNRSVEQIFKKLRPPSFWGGVKRRLQNQE
ncbi:MAG: putative metallopeptidase [Candidatus Shapirobacteria bacterium]